MRKKRLALLILLSFLVVGFVVGCGANSAPPVGEAPPVVVPPMADDIGNSPVLLVKKVDSMPEIDGNPNDAVWKEAVGIATDSTTLKAIYTDKEVAFLYSIKKPEMTIVTPDCWYYDGNEFVQWREYVDSQGIPPKREFTLLNMAWETSDFNMGDGGCEAMCHQNDDGSTRHVVPPGSSADFWNLLCKHGYGSPDRIYDTGFPLGYLGAFQEGTPTFNDRSANDPFKITSGSYTFIGWVDERAQTSFDDPDYTGKAGDTETGKYCMQCHSEEWVEGSSLQGKPGKMAYRRNAIGFDKMYATAPEYIKLNPKDFADAMVITDKDIADGKAVKIAGLSKDEIEKAWARYKEVNCLIPSFILQEPSDNMKQILYGARWADGYWTVEIKRNLTTPYPNDIQFDDINKKYNMQSAGLGVEQGIGVKVVFEKP